MDHNRDFWHKYFVNSFPVSNTACVKWLACKYKLCSHSLSCVLFKLHFTLNVILKLLHVIPGLFLNAKLSEYCYASHTIFCKHRVSLIYIYIVIVVVRVCFMWLNYLTSTCSKIRTETTPISLIDQSTHSVCVVSQK